MANRFLQQFRFAFEKMPTDVWGTVTFGASGAPTLDAVNSKGIASITRTGAGAYTITFQDVWPRLLQANALSVNATASASPGFQVVADNTATTAKTMQVIFTSSGTATDPASGETKKLHFVFKNSTAR